MPTPTPYTGHSRTRPPEPTDPLLTPGEVARLFRVDPKTVTRWAQDGRLASVRTPGGHRRFYQSVVYALLNASTGRSSIGDKP